jgi:hypothetical protein
MFYRLKKFVITSAHIALLWLTWKLVQGELDWGLTIGSLLLSTFWLSLTAVRLRQLLTTYFDVLSRLQVLVPFATGLVLSVVSFWAAGELAIKAAAVALAVSWLVVYGLYRRNRSNYIRQGHGPLPADSWVNVDWRAMLPGDLLLFSGDMAGRLHESVGHGELVLRNPQTGEMVAFSSYMAKGALFSNLERVTRARLRRGHYIVMRPRCGFTDEQNARAFAIAEQMIVENGRWRDRINKRRARYLSWLPLPASWKAALAKKFAASGYDWKGLFIGTRASDHWTCIGAVLENYERTGIKTRQYGTGLLGLGTGLLNPIMPVRFLADKAFELLTTAHQRAWEQLHPPATA